MPQIAIRVDPVPHRLLQCLHLREAAVAPALQTGILRTRRGGRGRRGPALHQARIPDTVPPRVGGRMPRVIIMVLLAVTAFAANSVFARLALGPAEIDAAGYTGVRLAAGAATLALLLARQRPLAIDAAVRTRWHWITAAALFGYAIAFSYAYELLDTGTGALILFTTVLTGMLGWAMIKGDRPGAVALGGIAVAFGAFVYLVSPGLVAPHPLGAALMIAAGLSWTV